MPFSPSRKVIALVVEAVLTKPGSSVTSPVGAQLRDVDSALLLGADGDREFKRLAFVVERDVRHRASPPKIPPEQ
jgi:hypothetical protein